MTLRTASISSVVVKIRAGVGYWAYPKYYVSCNGQKVSDFTEDRKQAHLWAKHFRQLLADKIPSGRQQGR